MLCVLDTCALLAWVTGVHELPAEAEPPYLLSAVSWCEIAWKVRLEKLRLAYPRAEWIRRTERLGVETVAIDREQCLIATDLDWAHRDPADRLIVALARQRKLPLVTCDGQITGFFPHCLW